MKKSIFIPDGLAKALMAATHAPNLSQALQEAAREYVERRGWRLIPAVKEHWETPNR